REYVPRAERAQQHLGVEADRHAVGARVAEVHGHRIAPVLAEDRPETPVDLGEGLVPRRGREHAAPAHERDAQAVRIGVELLEGVGLGTDEALAEDVRLVAADAGHLAPAGADLEPAGGLAQGADVVAGARAVLHDGRLTRVRAADATCSAASGRNLDAPRRRTRARAGRSWGAPRRSAPAGSWRSRMPGGKRRAACGRPAAWRTIAACRRTSRHLRAGRPA